MSIDVYPVVHVLDENQALTQTAAAQEAGADGIYLIDHINDSEAQLLKIYDAVKVAFPDFFVGVNILQVSSALRAMRILSVAYASSVIAEMPDGLWQDNADCDAVEALRQREKISGLHDVRYLGGVAFKRTHLYTDDPEEAALEAIRLSREVDVVTTSGPDTGIAPSAEKIIAMKEALGEQPLAIASGVDIDNLAEFKGHFDQLLVASSVETSPGSGEFDQVKLEALIEAAHE